MQQHPGQHLSDFVVQVAGDADPFGLLRGEHASAALLALALEPVEHAVEGPDNAADLIVTLDVDPLAAAQEVHGLHPPRQMPKRSERAPQKQHIRGQRDRQADDDDQRLLELDRRADRHRSDDQQNCDRRQQAAVDGEHAPEERDVARHPPTLARCARGGRPSPATVCGRGDQDRHRGFALEPFRKPAFEAAARPATST